MLSSTIGVDNRSSLSYQNPDNCESWHFCAQYLSELPKTWKTLHLSSTIRDENCNFQSYEILSTVSINILSKYNFQGYQNPVNC